MKLASNRKLYLYLSTIILLLLVFSFVSLRLNIEAGTYTYQSRMLEITESGLSELTTLTQDVPNLSVDTMSMKRFVALRDDLDGKYDAVYIGRGLYTPVFPGDQVSKSADARAKAMNTKDKNNDITKLKADQITTEFINKGLYVLFNVKTFEDNASITDPIKQSKLYKIFNGERLAKTKGNVKFLSDSELVTFISGLENPDSSDLTLLKQRPHLQITNRNDIVDYDPTTTGSKIYKTGERLTFNYSIANAPNLKNSPLTVKLYIGLDKSLGMTEQNVVAEQEVTSPTGTIGYTLPRTFSGPLYWKLEVADYHNITQLKDFDSGVIRYSGEKTIVNILQILPSTTDGSDNKGTDSKSSLLKESNMKEIYLGQPSDDYRLNITNMSIAEFNSYVNSTYDASNEYGLNGKYDMLIFGFRDEYHRYAYLNDKAISAIKQFIDEYKQSVLFTHDTVINLSNSNKDWVNNFKTITGQSDPVNNFGSSATNPSTKVKPVNDGLLMNYPFYLSKSNGTGGQVNVTGVTPKVALTHNQYFTLNLEDPAVVSWYNIESESDKVQRDTDDSWNHYYTYSKGNVTYSGTGHVFTTSSSTFPDWEQKLFVNTMYRAYIGANHAPEIAVTTPIEQSTLYSYQNSILLDYKVTDLDFNDRDLTTQIRFKQGATYISGVGMDKTAIKSGQSIYQSVPNPLPQGGALTIEIKAWDSKGAMATKLIPITVIEKNVNLDISRSLSGDVLNGKIDKNEKVTISYIVTPKTVPFDKVSTSDQPNNKQIISDIVFTEKLPPNLELNGDLPSGMTRTGNVEEGYSLSLSLNDISYTLGTQEGQKVFKPVSDEPLRFNFSVMPAVTGLYRLNDSKLSYIDIHADPAALTATNTPSPTVIPSSSAFGVAGEFGAFVLEDTTVTGGDISRNLASGGKTTVSRMSINKKGASIPYAVVTGGDFVFPEGSIYGNILYGGNFEKKDSGTIRGSYEKGSLIAFDAEGDKLLSLSASLAGLTANGTSKIQYSSLLVEGTDPTVNIIDVEASDFSKVSGLKINAPTNAVVILNIRGTSAAYLRGGYNLSGGVTGDKIVLNFLDTTHVNLETMDIRGSILAPQSTVSLNGGQVHGNLIAKSFTSKSTLEFTPFTGKLPISLPTPTPTPSPVPIELSRTELSFTELTFTAELRLKSLVLAPKTIYIGDEATTLIPTVLPADITMPALQWTIDSSTHVKLDTATGAVAGISVGTAQVTVTALDGSGLSSTATITVDKRTPRSLVINGNITALINEATLLSGIYTQGNQDNTASETNITYEWSVQTLEGTGTATLIADPSSPNDSTKTQFNALKSGRYIVTLTVTSSNPNRITAEKVITVANPLTGLTIQGNNTLMIGETSSLSAILTPLDADSSTLNWGFTNSDDTAFAEVIPSTTDEAIAMFTAGSTARDVQVQVTSGSITSSPFTIHIVELIRLKFGSPEISIQVGESRSLMDLLWTEPVSITLDQIKNDLNWDSSIPSDVIVDNTSTDVNARGRVTGKKKGHSVITVTYQNRLLPNKPSISCTILVKVVDAPNGDRY